MSTGKRLAKRSIIGTRVCAPGDDGKYYAGVIHAVKTPAAVLPPGDETRYSVRFDAATSSKQQRLTFRREFRESELIGPGFRSVTGCHLQPGQRAYLTFNGREVAGEVRSHDTQRDEVVVTIWPPGHEVSTAAAAAAARRPCRRPGRQPPLRRARVPRGPAYPAGHRRSAALPFAGAAARNSEEGGGGWGAQNREPRRGRAASGFRTASQTACPSAQL
ncbi:hypothetical protein ONE63_006883 [Megalurothrips usitatus]|uniref:DUF4772 domain-containing protein n=1 Tax=Megalurothrips usitatus TaxID=439358 RepID=A0AAV7XTS9_9NEOP|nr:hypothetical protein ONE63_006883 [Megalurothrips usitatus]